MHLDADNSQNPTGTSTYRKLAYNTLAYKWPLCSRSRVRPLGASQELVPFPFAEHTPCTDPYNRWKTLQPIPPLPAILRIRGLDNPSSGLRLEYSPSVSPLRSYAYGALCTSTYPLDVTLPPVGFSFRFLGWSSLSSHQRASYSWQ